MGILPLRGDPMAGGSNLQLIAEADVLVGA